MICRSKYWANSVLKLSKSRESSSSAEPEKQAIEDFTQSIADRSTSVIESSILKLTETEVRALKAVGDAFAKMAERELNLGHALAEKKEKSAKLHAIVTQYCEDVRRLQVGGSIPLIAGFGHRSAGEFVPMVFVVTREDGGTFVFSIVNCGYLCSSHHPSFLQDYPAVKYQTLLSIPAIPLERMGDASVWFLILHLRQSFVWDGASLLYEALLPFLANGSIASICKNQAKQPWPNFDQFETVSDDDNGIFACVLTAQRFLLSQSNIASFSKHKQEALHFATRFATFEAAAKEVEEARHGGSVCAADGHSITFACRVLAREAANLSSREIQESTYEALGKLSKWLPGVSSNDENPGGSSDQKLGFTAAFQAFSGFNLVSTPRETDNFAGPPIIMPSALFVELDVGSATGCTNFTEACEALHKCELLCNKLRGKSLVSPASIAVHQIVSMIEHYFTQYIPLPVPPNSAMAATCIWQTPTDAQGKSVRPDKLIKLHLLSSIKTIVEHYLSASFSMCASPAKDFKRITTMGCLLLVFDTVLRLNSENASTDLLLSRIFKEKGKQCRFSTCSFHGTSLAYLLQNKPCTDPTFLKARGAVLGYFAAKSDGFDRTFLNWKPGKLPDDGDNDMAGGTAETQTYDKESESIPCFQPSFDEMSSKKKDDTLSIVQNGKHSLFYIFYLVLHYHADIAKTKFWKR
jgi:hypothetical protein